MNRINIYNKFGRMGIFFLVLAASIWGRKARAGWHKPIASQLTGGKFRSVPAKRPKVTRNLKEKWRIEEGEIYPLT